eukprot:TRINITY_DN13634_c0_g1_i1.p1 TRINITY_DN13634_c0_g1~~TRINITY_DN13634_c0_g1_i1.p1  ORF type:complete len:130 (-),score=13.56 TRINITY_DN13634_c0_g1_i1:192-581(-)
MPAASARAQRAQSAIPNAGVLIRIAPDEYLSHLPNQPLREKFCQIAIAASEVKPSGLLPTGQGVSYCAWASFSNYTLLRSIAVELDDILARPAHFRVPMSSIRPIQTLSSSRRSLDRLYFVRAVFSCLG